MSRDWIVENLTLCEKQGSMGKERQGPPDRQETTYFEE